MERAENEYSEKKFRRITAKKKCVLGQNFILLLWKEPKTSTAKRNFSKMKIENLLVLVLTHKRIDSKRYLFNVLKYVIAIIAFE